MATTDTKTRVESVFQECFGEESLEKFRDHPSPFTTHAEAVNTPGASELLDSLDRVEFVMALEDEFHAELPDNDEKLCTLTSIVEYLEGSAKQ